MIGYCHDTVVGLSACLFVTKLWQFLAQCNTAGLGGWVPGLGGSSFSLLRTLLLLVVSFSHKRRKADRLPALKADFCSKLYISTGYSRQRSVAIPYVERSTIGYHSNSWAVCDIYLKWLILNHLHIKRQFVWQNCRFQRISHNPHATTSAVTLSLLSMPATHPRRNCRQPRQRVGLIIMRRVLHIGWRQVLRLHIGRPIIIFGRRRPVSQTTVASTTPSTVPVTRTKASAIWTDRRRWVVQRVTTLAGSSPPVTAATSTLTTVRTSPLANSVTLTGAPSSF